MLESLKTILSSSLFDGDPTVDIEGEAVPVRMRRNTRARRMSLRADAVKREIRVTLPSYTPSAEAMDFIEQKREWIAARLQSMPAAVPLQPGAEIALEGHVHTIRWQADWPRGVIQYDGELRLGGPQDMIAPRILRWLKARARETFTAEIAHYCKIAGVAPLKLKLGDPRSRWGSCSTRGTIALSWRLIMAPPHVRRSVIAHEVAHIRHMNHSPAFYAWMAEIFEGDVKSADQWLKQHGSALHLVGR